MTSFNGSDESQGSQELAKLLAGRRPEITDPDLSQKEQTNPRSSGYSQREFHIRPNMHASGQDQNIKQTHPFDDHADHSSQKENHSSPDSSRHEAHYLSDNARVQPTKSADQNRAQSPNPIIQSEAINHRPHVDQTSPALRGLPQPDSSPSGSELDPLSPSQALRPPGSEMQFHTWGANMAIVERWEAKSPNRSPTKRQADEAQSQESQGSAGELKDLLDDEDDEIQAQVVSQFDLSFSDRMPDYDGTQPQTQATQSTQPTDADNSNTINDQEWKRYTGMQVDPRLRKRYLESAKIGAGADAFRQDDFYDEAFATSPADHQNPVGTPDPSFSEQEVATQIIEGALQEAATQIIDGAEEALGATQPHEDRLTPIQYPAGTPPLPDPFNDEMETQIATQINTQIEDDSRDDDSTVPAHLGVSPLPVGPLAPAVPQDSSLSGLAGCTGSNHHSTSCASAYLFKDPANREIVPESEPPVPSPQLSTAVSRTPPQRLTDNGTKNQEIDDMDIDTDDEDNQPLASIMLKTNVRDKAVMEPLPKRSTKAEGKMRQVASVDAEATGSSNHASSRILTPFSDFSYVPTEVSDEADFVSKKKGKGLQIKPKRKAKASTPASSTSSIRKSTRSTRNRRDMAESDEEDMGQIKEEDNATEFDDEYYVTPAPSTIGESSRKRKRIAASSVSRKLSKQEPSSAKRTPTLHRVAVDLKSPVRVLALWTDGQWYCGSIVTFMAPDTYEVAFDDGSKLKARIGSLRNLDLKKGDDVRVLDLKKAGKVVELRGEGRDMTVSVAIGSHVSDWKCRDFCVQSDKVEAQWKDRVLDGTLGEIEDPTAAYEVPENADSFLKDCGIIVTIKDANEHHELHNDICAVMAGNRATLLEDWTDALTAQGTYTPSGWKITKEEVRWFEDMDKPNSLRRVFVIADTESTKPKYLIGLALGVPCLSSQYILDRRKGQDWKAYLLPHGMYNSPLAGDVRLSQSVNLAWGSKPEHLSNIMENPTASKLFKSLSILCVGDNYIPEREKCDSTPANIRRISKSKIASGEALVILAMGASQVTAVANLSDASKKEHFDYVVFKRNKPTGTPKGGGTTHVSWDWVKQSLIRGELLPVY
ncbi:hypothetical protein D9757_007703 [Collybiopsis confluens]|uniref:Tudor domain-containing protein n=1 Tax=Collybiopsis confluens TaxID=2823264 RepID=A0A8H5M1D5_9AGAR|nr:hypothetical protein D9757_007703 [Collybiopsis confluens]